MARSFEDYQRALIDDLRAHEGTVSDGPLKGRTMMLLTTKGARSGQERRVVVTCSRDGDRYVIAASKGGAPTNPSWYYNLVANPVVTIEVGGAVFEARATEAHGPERDRLWTQHADRWPEFQAYPTKTDRVIPMFTVEPVSSREA